jgi:hypothetical protein
MTASARSCATILGGSRTMRRLLLFVRAPPAARRFRRARRRGSLPGFFARFFGANNFSDRPVGRLLRGVELFRQLFQAIEEDFVV